MSNHTALTIGDFWLTTESLVLLLLGLGLGLLVKIFLPSYISAKGKNLATKEDIANITNQIEDIKSIYFRKHQELIHQQQLTLELMKANTQMSLAAVELRLAAHQQAYSLWRKLLRNIHEDSVREVVIECEDWWNNNCLYLSSNARQGFLEAFWYVHDHSSLLKDKTNQAAITENFKKIMSAGEKISAGVELPPIGDRELKSVIKPQSEIV